MTVYDFHSPGGIETWVRMCHFETDAKAAEELGLPIRTFYRWKANGIPNTAIGRMGARLMREIRKARAEERAA